MGLIPLDMTYSSGLSGTWYFAQHVLFLCEVGQKRVSTL